jgi:hypothetical protein
LTKLYIYCLFDGKGVFHGVYSSLKSAHRDALKVCNQGVSGVVIRYRGEHVVPTLSLLKKIFNGELDIKVEYVTNGASATLIKTKLKE